MKHSLVVFSLFFTSISFAGTIGNGVKLSNLPTASKSYSVKVISEGEISALFQKVEANCEKDKAEAIAIISKLGSKVLSEEGCKAKIIGGYYDQGGSDMKVETKFEVVFK